MLRHGQLIVALNRTKQPNAVGIKKRFKPQLEYLLDHNCDGADETQAARHDRLMRSADLLVELGFKLEGLHSFKRKHIKALVLYFQENDLSEDTIKNYLSDYRWVLQKTGRANVLPALNSELEFFQPTKKRQRRNRAWRLSKADLARVEDPYVAAVLLGCAAFGLRVEEAIKLQPFRADRGDHLALDGSWCKNGRPRIIPIRHARQREALAHLKRIAASTPKKSMIPGGSNRLGRTINYIVFKRQVEYQVIKYGFGNLHGLRYNYAQWVYSQETDGRLLCAYDGGVPPEGDREWRLHRHAIRIVSRDLGHDRPEEAYTYLGHWQAPGGCNVVQFPQFQRRGQAA